MATLIPESRILEGLGADPLPLRALGCWGHRSCYDGKTKFPLLGEWVPGRVGWWVVGGAHVSLVMVGRVAGRLSEVPGQCTGSQSSLWSRPWTAECCQNAREFQELKTMAPCLGHGPGKVWGRTELLSIRTEGSL